MVLNCTGSLICGFCFSRNVLEKHFLVYFIVRIQYIYYISHKNVLVDFILLVRLLLVNSRLSVVKFLLSQRLYADCLLQWVLAPLPNSCVVQLYLDRRIMVFLFNPSCIFQASFLNIIV